MAGMANARYDPEWVAAFYDAYGATEWDRMARNSAHAGRKLIA